MAGKYDELEKYLRSLPVNQEDVTLTFTLIEQILNESPVRAALHLSPVRAGSP